MKNIFLLVCLFFVQTAFAQVYNITSYSVGEGLMQSQVWAIHQDSKGFLWVGTHRGACRFDGKNFVDFLPESGLAGSFINAIAEDKTGNIWFGTEKGVSCWDGMKFRRLIRAEGWASKEVHALYVDKENTVWIGTKGGGLVKYQQNKFITNTSPQTNLPTNVNTISPDEKGNLWIGTNDGLFLYNEKTQNMTLIEASKGLEIYSVLNEGMNEVWIGTNKGVWKYDNHHFVNLGEKNPSLKNQIYTITKDKKGIIWFGSNIGLARQEMGVFSEFHSQQWAENQIVRSSCVDREGNVWIGTDGAGLSKFRRGIFTIYNKENKLSSELAKSFLEDESGNMWVSTTNNGINLLSGGKISYLTKENGLCNNDICYSYKDNKGGFWFGSYSQGVSLYENGRFTNFNLSNGLKSNSVYCIAEDKRKNMWFGTASGISIWNGNSFRYISTKDNLTDERVYAIFPDSKGNVWVGTANGVSCIKENEAIQNFSMKEGLSDNLVLTILEDKKGWLWFATRKGLSVFTGKEWLIIDIPGKSASNDIVGMVFDDHEKLWLGTNNGVFRMDVAEYYKDKERLVFRHFSEADGLPSLECNGNAAFKDAKGNIWIGTISGAAVFPAQTTTEEEELLPVPHILDVRLFFKELKAWDIRPDSINKNSGLPENLVLAYNFNHLTFNFIGICNKNTNAVRYQFMLEGFENDWQPITDETFATYNYLKPGTYTFKVRATNDSGKWTEVKTFSFKIERPYWLQWWFILLEILLVGAVATIIFFTIRDRNRQRTAQKQMKERAEMLQLEHQALYAMMNPHFTFNALQSIQYFIHSQDKLAATKFLSNFAKLVRMNLDSSKSDFISLNDEIERLKLYLSLEKMRFQEKFDYEIIVDEEIDKSGTLIPPMILQPFVENSIKHGIMPLDYKGEIRVEIFEKDDVTLQVSIIDNGIGIEASKKMKADRPSSHVSKGMLITQERLKLFANMTGKEYAIDISEVHKEGGEVGGTKVSISLPMKYGK
jgi:ligand-binding sensor domain-containing protein/cellobiose-specific phosphotransferase system component IIA